MKWVEGMLDLHKTYKAVESIDLPILSDKDQGMLVGIMLNLKVGVFILSDTHIPRAMNVQVKLNTPDKGT